MVHGPVSGPPHLFGEGNAEQAKGMRQGCGWSAGMHCCAHSSMQRGPYPLLILSRVKNKVILAKGVRELGISSTCLQLGTMPGLARGMLIPRQCGEWARWKWRLGWRPQGLQHWAWGGTGTGPRASPWQCLYHCGAAGSRQLQAGAGAVLPGARCLQGHG